MKTILLAGLVVLPLSLIAVYLVVSCLDQFGLLFSEDPTEQGPKDQEATDVANKQQ